MIKFVDTEIFFTEILAAVESLKIFFSFLCNILSFQVRMALFTQLCFFFIALFLCGRNKYKKVPPEGNIVLLVGCAVGVSIKKKCYSSIIIVTTQFR